VKLFNRDDPVPQLTPEEELEVELPKVSFADVTTMTLEDATRMALQVSASFEGHDGFSQVTGNFDSQGLSCGALQWTWKQGTQQKLVLKCDVVEKYMRTMGSIYVRLAGLPITKSEPQIMQWSRGAKVLEPYNTELRTLWGSPEMIDVQVYFSNTMAKKADLYSRDWITKSGRQDYTIQEFCFFFDIVVNNGSLLFLTYDDVFDRMTSNGRSKVISEIIDWCESRADRDCRRNAVLWASMVNSAEVNQVDLLCLAWLRSLKAKSLYQSSVMNRHGTLAMGIGYSDSEKRDVNTQYAGVWPHRLIS
jgi:hypothetical protein